LRGAFREEIESLLAFLEERVSGEGPAARRVRAIGMLATCVGALAMARAVDSPTLANEILTAGRRALVASTRRSQIAMGEA
jgi:TetR/AcrR family transcriptional repressor of nem operon